MVPNHSLVENKSAKLWKNVVNNVETYAQLLITVGLEPINRKSLVEMHSHRVFPQVPAIYESYIPHIIITSILLART